MDIKDLRNQIDDVDRRLCEVFKERMEIVDKVSEHKLANNIPVKNVAREQQVLLNVSKNLGPELEEYGRSLYRVMFELSRSYESRTMTRDTPLYKRIQEMINESPKIFPKRATVACQGCEGAYSQLAASKLFEVPDVMFTMAFDGVFKAVSGGLCEFGILPIENSTAGSVNDIYDKLAFYNVHIVRSQRVKIDHSLLAKKGARIEDIKTIYSHQQALSQSTDFLSSLPGVRVIACENTAVAARRVAESDDMTCASLSSRYCADLYDLETLADSVQNQDNNYTRFICISKKEMIFPGANRTSLVMVVPNRPGTLFNVLAKFNAIGANLVKLESRPIPGRDFEFMFYFDIEASIYDESFTSLICDLASQGEQFRYLGTYQEMI